jgi:hypothetical protein
VDAAIDGSFLYDLNEDDLKNSLGRTALLMMFCGGRINESDDGR